MVSAAYNNAQLAPVVQVAGHAPSAQAKGPAVHRVVIRRATAARHHAVTPPPGVYARPIAPVARSEPAQAWAQVPALGRVPEHQAGQPHAAPAAIRQIAHVVRLSLTIDILPALSR